MKDVIHLGTREWIYQPFAVGKNQKWDPKIFAAKKNSAAEEV